MPLWVQDWIMQIQFSAAFLLGTIIAFNVSKTPWRELLPAPPLLSTHFNGLIPIRQRIDYKLATLVHRSLHSVYPNYLSSLLHPTRQLLSISLNPVSTLPLPLADFGMPPRFETPSLLISDLSTLSNPTSELTYSLLIAFLALNNTLCAYD